MVAVRALLVLSVLLAQRVSRADESISSSMIVEMREITSVSVAPNGARVVIGICHPNPRTNENELSWVVVPLIGTAEPITVPAGEEISDPAAPGAILSQQAQWSPDGKWFFYLRRDGAEVQLWETAWNGEKSRQVTHSKSDLIGLTASADPNELTVTLAPDRNYLNKAEEEENRRGILYDDRVIGGFPLSETLPVIDRWRNVRQDNNGAWEPTGWTGTITAVFDVARRQLQMRSGGVPNVALDSAKYRVTVVPTGQASVVDPQY